MLSTVCLGLQENQMLAYSMHPVCNGGKQCALLNARHAAGCVLQLERVNVRQGVLKALIKVIAMVTVRGALTTLTGTVTLHVRILAAFLGASFHRQGTGYGVWAFSCRVVSTHCLKRVLYRAIQSLSGNTAFCCRLSGSASKLNMRPGGAVFGMLCGPHRLSGPRSLKSMCSSTCRCCLTSLLA